MQEEKVHTVEPAPQTPAYIFPSSSPIWVGFPTPTWEWSIFGSNLMVVTLSEESDHVATWWRRLITGIFLGSTWRKL